MIEHLAGRAHVAPGGVNIGVVLTDRGTAILIDTGLNDTAARKVLRQLDEWGRTVSTIITTHGHADHFGGNSFVVRRTGARVLAPEWDESVLRYPLFQPICLFAGADPPDALRSGFLLADPSPVDAVYEPGSLDVDGVTFEVVSLGGHSGNQLGLVVDGVFYCADVVFPARVLERYRIPYLYSVRQHLASLDRAGLVEHQVAVPGHGPLLEPIADSVDLNRQVVLDVAEAICGLASEPATPETLLDRLLTELDVVPADLGAYYLLHPTLFAFLTYLEEQGRLETQLIQGRPHWEAI